MLGPGDTVIDKTDPEGTSPENTVKVICGLGGHRPTGQEGQSRRPGERQRR